jgi:Amidohydrolase family
MAALSRMMLALLCLAPCAQGADLLIENVTIVSPEREEPRAAHSVLIRAGRIVQVSNEAITASRDTRRLDGRGKFLTPGIMDSHVHVTIPPGLPLGSTDPTLTRLADAFHRQQPRSYLYFGVTQLLDPANFAAGIQAFEAQPQRPDLFRCGIAPALDGYPMVLIDKQVRYRVLPDYIYEPANAKDHPLPAGVDAAAHTPEAVVSRIAASGALCVKVLIETGFGGHSNWPMLSKDTLQRVRVAATQRGLLLVAHANALRMQRIALESQVDVIAHGLWNWDEAAGEPGVPPQIAAHLRRVHESKTGIQATLRVLPGIADLFRADTLKDPMYRKVVPAPLLAWYPTDAGQWFKREMQRDIGDLPESRIAAIQLQAGEQGMRAARYLSELGHPLLLGSDTPSAPTYGNQPGYDTYREMRLMAQAGVSLPAILRAATINNARQFRLDKDYGTVTEGKIANLLLLTENPLQTVHAWSRIDKVILHGEVIDRESLAADRSPG